MLEILALFLWIVKMIKQPVRLDQIDFSCLLKAVSKLDQIAKISFRGESTSIGVIVTATIFYINGTTTTVDITDFECW